MNKIFLQFIFLLLFTSAFAVNSHQNIGTFSIAAYDPVMEEWGIAVQSRFFAVGAVVPEAKAGLGAIATQAWGNTLFKDKAMEMFEKGMKADDVLKALLESDSNAEYRQVGIVDKWGNTAAFTGKNCSSWAGHIEGKYYTVQGNILAGENVLSAMADAFEKASGTLGERMLAALYAGQEEGGDSRGMQSAGMLIVCENGGYSGFDDRMVDIRVDDSKEPIKELERLYYINEATFMAGAYMRTAVQAFKSKKNEKAEKAFDIAVSIIDKQKDEAVILNSAAWEMAINDYRLDKALEFALRAVEVEPKDANIWDTVGEIYYRMGRIDDAVNAEKKASELMPDSELFREKLKEWSEK